LMDSKIGALWPAALAICTVCIVRTITGHKACSHDHVGESIHCLAQFWLEERW
jgi:hypothetical protein